MEFDSGPVDEIRPEEGAGIPIRPGHVISKHDWHFFQVDAPMQFAQQVTKSQEEVNNRVHQYLQQEDPSALEGMEGEQFVKSMPEMFFGKNQLIIFNNQNNIALEFSPFDSLAQCVQAVRD